MPAACGPDGRSIQRHFGYHYENDPSGNDVLVAVSLSAGNQYRFSTKYFDSEVNLYYYGYRYYSSELGRWINRDPIEEDGGYNLYAFVFNSALNAYDLFGAKIARYETTSNIPYFG